MSDTAVMAAKKKKGTPADRHKPTRMARVRDSLAKQLDKLADRNATDFTEELNRAVRELLEKEGLWPSPVAD
jgi:hypothetical protein